MNKWGLVLTAALAATLAALPARAQDSGSFYIGLSGAASYTDAARSMEQITGGLHDKATPNGGKLYAGYVSGNWGMEFGYYNLGKIEIDNAGGQVQDELETTAIVVAAVYEAPIGAGYSFVGRLGIAFTQAKYDCLLACGTMPFVDTKESGTSGMFGLGLDARIAQHFTLRMEYEHIGSVHHSVGNIGFKDAYDMISVGVRLVF